MGWSCSALASDTMERLFSLHNNKGVIEYLIESMQMVEL